MTIPISAAVEKAEKSDSRSFDLNAVIIHTNYKVITSYKKKATTDQNLLLLMLNDSSAVVVKMLI